MSAVENLIADSALDEAVRDARTAFTARNPNSAKQYAQATEVMPGGNTRTVLFYEPFPLTILRGQGCEVFDADGHRYFDFMGEYTAGLAGHSNKIIADAIKAAIDNGLSLSGHTRVEAEFAAIVTKRFPAMELLRFTNSGTEATLLSLTLARIATGRKKVLAFDGGYHGAVFVFKDAVNQINAPFDWLFAPYNDAAAAAKLIAQHGSDLAAVIVEPMQGSGGCIPAEQEFLTTLRQETARVGAMLVFDEVMTSRLAPGGLQTRYGIRPDLMTLGKYVGGGMSFGAFGGRADLMRRFDPRQAGCARSCRHVQQQCADHVGRHRRDDQGRHPGCARRGQRTRRGSARAAAGVVPAAPGAAVRHRHRLAVHHPWRRGAGPLQCGHHRPGPAHQGTAVLRSAGAGHLSRPPRHGGAVVRDSRCRLRRSCRGIRPISQAARGVVCYRRLKSSPRTRLS